MAIEHRVIVHGDVRTQKREERKRSAGRTGGDTNGRGLQAFVIDTLAYDTQSAIAASTQSGREQCEPSHQDVHADLFMQMLHVM